MWPGSNGRFDSRRGEEPMEMKLQPAESQGNDLGYNGRAIHSLEGE